MSKKKCNLLVVAHPDDETIFFGGLLQRRRSKLGWTVVCVTSDGSAKRKAQFKKACELLNVDHFEWWAFEDRYDQRLPIELISNRLRTLPEPHEVFSHGIIGEYGHPHHQDVCKAVFDAFSGKCKIFSCAYNAFPKIRIRLTSQEFKTKAHLLTQVYGSETNRFLNVLPATSEEGFLELTKSEVDHVYKYLTQKKSGTVKFQLGSYQWLESFFPRLKDLKRPF